MWITRVSIRNPVFATMVMVGIAVLGLFAYNRLRVEQMPDVNLPFVFVQTNYPGANPEVVETDVTKPLEYAINTVSGVEQDPLEFARRGGARCSPSSGWRPTWARRCRTCATRSRRSGPASRATSRIRSSIRADQENQQPVVSLAVLSPTLDLRELTSLTDQTIVKGLENVPGVARIDVNGRVTRQILIQIKPSAADRRSASASTR